MKEEELQEQQQNSDETTAVLLYIPAHLNAALEDYQAECKKKEGQKPSKQAAIFRMMAEFFAVRVTATALILAVFLAGCAPLPIRRDMPQDLAPLPVQVIRHIENQAP